MANDAQIGRNLASLRNEMSQKDLAEAMRSLGFKWSQATVWSVEKGERPLRLTEATALQEIFGVRFDSLTHNLADFAALEARRRVIESLKQLEDAAARVAVEIAMFEGQVRHASETALNHLARNAKIDPYDWRQDLHEAARAIAANEDRRTDASGGPFDDALRDVLTTTLRVASPED